MRREQVIAALEAYQPTNKQELLMAVRMKDFIKANPGCFERSQPEGHMTASAWITNREQTACVLLHHAKLQRWLQPGGHADGQTNLLQVALKEATEETGLTSLSIVSSAIFDVDIHPIPANAKDPAHDHYDVRFHFFADLNEVPTSNHESRACKWVPFSRLTAYTQEESVLRMARKSLAGSATQERPL